MNLRYVFLSLLISACLYSCKKDEFGALSDIRPEVPVTVGNVYDYRPAPTVKASKAENKIVITLQLPAASGRVIREVSRIAASTTANFTAIYSGTTVGTGTSNLWSVTPIPVNATTYTFTTSFTEYNTKTGATALPASNALLGRDFYFLLTLDNGQTVIPQNIRVWVVD